MNEVELLIMVTPELVAPMDPDEVPPCGPGLNTTTPTDWELFMKGHVEVPNCCPNGDPNAPPDGKIGPDSGVLTPGASRSAGAQLIWRFRPSQYGALSLNF